MPRDQDDLGPWLDDYIDWISETGATGGESGDPDFDGWDNAFEYAFGQNPTSGTRSSPVVGPLDITTGKFTYTRRLVSLTSFNYRVFTSSTLDTWTEDLSAVSAIVSTNGNVETVEVTLSAQKPLAGPRLFVRVEVE